MDRTDCLHEMAEKAHCGIYSFELNKAHSLVIEDEDECDIAIDFRKINTRAEYNRLLSHELGHIESGALLSMRSPYEPMGRVEYRAKKYSILRTFPIDALLESIQSNRWNLYEIADDFEATVPEIIEAIEFYEAKGEL